MSQIPSRRTPIRAAVRLARLAGAGALAALVLAAPGVAQEAPPSTELGFPWDSGAVANLGTRPEVVISKTIHVQGADWLQLHFQAVQLAGDPAAGDGSILRITSFQDGAVQELNQLHVQQWQNRTAYFNGDTLQVEVLAMPGTGANRIVTRKLDAGIAPSVQFSQCGPADNRVASNDARTARVLPVGCTAWIFDDCNRCFGTAGHCAGSSLQTVQFNVPLSSASGSLNHPPPQDQYAVDVSSKQQVNGGVGNDWGYFGCHPNSNTGLTAFQRQGQSHSLAAATPPFNISNTIRITGYGTDSGSANQTQQTHDGPWFASFGTTLQYTVDTTGGNSGSPVLHEDTGEVIGVHTHGGCSSIGGNQGTAVNNGGWKNALNNPQGVCSTAGSASVYCTSKVNSLGCTPVISTLGLPKEGGAPGSFWINAAQIRSQQPGVLFYGFLPDNAAFGGGFRCVAPPTTRTAAQQSNGSASGNDCTGNFSYDMGGRIGSGIDPALVCGTIVYAQYWSRDPGFTPPNNIALTAGVRFVIGE